MTQTHFTILDAPSDADLARCVHCGLCLNQCPTYRITGLETESPRGRLFLIRGFAEGTQQINAQFAEHIGLCLGCRNCETVCPSGVRFGHLLEAARGEMIAQKKIGRIERAARWIIFKQIFPHPARLNALAALIALYQRMGLQKILRASGALKLFGRIGALEALLPSRRVTTFRFRTSRVSEMEHGKQGALFTGCIMRAAFGDIHDATVNVLEQNDWRITAPTQQVCCGALHLHAGEREWAKELARQNIDAFARSKQNENSNDAPIIVNAAGCGAVLKEYGELLRNDPVYAQRAHEFSARVLDVSEALAQTPLANMRAQKLRVTYQEPCHLAHGQQIKKQPREILNQVPGIDFVEMTASDRCCGSAGIYNVLHPEIANVLIDEKMANIAATGAEVVVTGNIGCLLQLEYGKSRSGWTGRVMHLVELLDAAE
ncbi:MAG: 4Fe-4S dicluster domain-containing protein [Chloroflexi bacterium]|nr:4Fe-4S dicluster domain-containing protein [Chloroflexota bacterium]